MRIISWNINGLISWVDSQSYLPIEDLEPDVFCAQEIRTKRDLTALEGYYHYWNPCERDGLHGTMTLSKTEPLRVIYGTGNKELDAEGRVLTIELPTLYVVNCYAPRAETLERHEFRRRWDESLQEFVGKLQEKGKQIVLCGDFNALRSELDVFPENEREQHALQGIFSEERSNLEKLIEMGFVDAYRRKYPFEEDCYTWWSNRTHKREENRGWRLDYFFLSAQAADAIIKVAHLPDIKGSDHAPILLELDAVFTDEDLAREWSLTDWHEAEKLLEQLQQELTRAVFAKDREKVFSLQESIVNRQLIKRLAVRHASESTSTPGVDKLLWKTPAEKMLAAKKLNERPYFASPLRQIVIIDKKTGKQRNIGIPTIYDKAMHVLYSYALAPVMEATSEGRSFGFRRGRSALDVHENIKDALLAPDAPEFIVHSDIKAFYASIQHKWLTRYVPMDKAILGEFLRAGHVFAGELVPSDGFGMSEGSTLSPILANIILNGLQKHIYLAMGVWRKRDMDYANGRMIRYVDDVLFTVRSERDGRKLIAALEDFLRQRGLSISHEKTYIARTDKKFTFLAMTYWMEYGIFHSVPSDGSVRKFIAELEDTVSRSSNKSQRELIQVLNRKLVGWASYFRITDAQEAFHKIDAALHGMLLKAAYEKHPKMQHAKVIEKYWFKGKEGKPVYALQNDKSVRLVSMSDIPIIRHKPILHRANPYTDAGYFEVRDHEKAVQHISYSNRSIWERQGGRCYYCGRPILPDQKKTIVTIDLCRPVSPINSAYIHQCCKYSEMKYIGHMGNPYELSELDVMELLEEVSNIQDHRKNQEIEELKKKWKASDAKWSHMPLKRYFGVSIKPRITLTFRQIEEIEGRKLHPAHKTEAYWSEKKYHKCIADAWKSEGYELAELNMEHETVTVRRVSPRSLLKIPEELTKQKLPEDAKYELETYFKYIIRKYGLKLS